MNLHNQQFSNPCHYFNNDMICPYEELGCKFLHIASKLCKHGDSCHKRKCPFRHEQEQLVCEKDVTNMNMDSEISELEEYDNEKKNVEFVTSTPEKRKFECEECHEKTHCVECYVQQENQSCSQFFPDSP